MDIDNLIAAYAGRNYAEPRSLVAATIDFSDYDDVDSLINALTAFKTENAGMTFQVKERESDYSDYMVGFDAIRIETPDEVAARIAGYRQYVMVQQARRRAEYEHMKREFGE